jgi:predicted phage replisome organizer
MAEVKWIKIVTDIFDNRKIKLIRKLPEGAEIVVTWFQLLCLAGETNDNGLIYVTKAIPYTEETLATAFDTPLPIIRLALDTFQQLEMITVYNSFLCVANWEKYQNIDGLTKIREQTRKRVANHRAKQKELSSGNVTVTLPVTHCNAIEEDIDIDKDKELDKSTGAAAPTLPPIQRHKHGDYGWVRLTDDEYQRLIKQYGECTTQHFIAYVDESAQRTGNKNKWKDWNLTVRKAIRENWGGERSGKAGLDKSSEAGTGEWNGYKLKY